MGYVDSLMGAGDLPVAAVCRTLAWVIDWLTNFASLNISIACRQMGGDGTTITKPVMSLLG